VSSSKPNRSRRLRTETPTAAIATRTSSPTATPSRTPAHTPGQTTPTLIPKTPSPGLMDIYFEWYKDDVTYPGATPLAQNQNLRTDSDLIKREVASNKIRAIVVQGHADIGGDPKFDNQRLGRRRATRVIDALVVLGIPRAMMTAESCGTSRASCKVAPIRPQYPNVGCWKNDRRVHIVVAPPNH